MPCECLIFLLTVFLWPLGFVFRVLEELRGILSGHNLSHNLSYYITFIYHSHNNHAKIPSRTVTYKYTHIHMKKSSFQDKYQHMSASNCSVRKGTPGPTDTLPNLLKSRLGCGSVMLAPPLPCLGSTREHTPCFHVSLRLLMVLIHARLRPCLH